MPKRASVDDYFAQLPEGQRSHLEELRKLSHQVGRRAREELKWNLPVYVGGEKTNLWMLQNYKNHCSLRFTPAWFADHRAAVEAAGYEAGEGFVKIPYTRPVPTKLVTSLIKARLADYEAGT
jgi:uncharacterized protein YdhG (YjbR/CyaY superfamily)